LNEKLNHVNYLWTKDPHGFTLGDKYQMKTLHFIKELTESRMFFGPTDLKQMSVDKIAEIVYLMFMMLEVIRQYKPNYTAIYATDTLKYNTYDNMHYAGTDLGNLMAVLNNQDTFDAYIKGKSGISIPLFQINRYLRDVSAKSKNSHSDDVSFMWRLEDYLKFYSNSLLRQLRRDIGNWKDLTLADKQQIYLILRREFDKRCSSVDMYLYYKSSFKITESITESKSITESAEYLGNCVDAFDNKSGECVLPGLYQNTYDFAWHEEEYKEISRLEFNKAVGTIDPNIDKIIRNRSYFYDEDSNIYIIYDNKTDVHYFFRGELNEAIDTKLEYHKELNPELWNGYELKPDVKEALGKIANKFAEFVDVKQLRIIDYVITGSNCAFNYTSQSDIDLHIEMDTSNLGDCPLVDPFLTAKKALWNSGHDITIKGYNVELYAEDVRDEEKLVATGVYSLLHDKWIKKPKYKEITYNDAAVQAKVEDLMNQIDDLIKNQSTDEKEIHNLREHIKKMRRAGLEKGGEFDVSNLAFKVLRNYGYLDKLSELKRNKQDIELSLDEEEETNRLDIEVTGDWAQRVFIEAYLQEKHKTWLSSPELGSTKIKRGSAIVNINSKENNAYISWIDAKPTGQKFGSELLGYIIDQLRAHDIAEVRCYIEWHNYASKSMVQKAGFKQIETKEHGSLWELKL
jgi:hypothetical protein